MALIPGALLQERALKDVQSHIDKASVFNLMADRKPEDFGLLDLWASKNVKDIPLYAGMILNNDVKYVDGAITFSLPVASDTSTKIVSNPNTTTNNVGRGGEEFVLILNNNYLGGYGSIVTFDKMSNAPELEVTGIKEQGDHFAYRFKIVQGSGISEDKFVPSEYLTPGSKLFKMAGINSPEFGQNYDSFAFKGASERKYIQELATAELQIHYNMTRQGAKFASSANLSMLGEKTLQAAKDSVIEYLFMDSPVDPQIKYMSDYKGDAKPKSHMLVYTLDDICINMLAKEDSEYCMYGKGGLVGYGDGLDKVRLPMGIYHQLDKRGYKDVYDLPTFSLDTLKNAYRKFTSGKVPVIIQGKEPVVRVRTGKGGMQLVSPLIEKHALTSLGGYQQQADKLGIITGDAKTGLGVTKPFYNTLRLPGEVEFQFEYEPSFDPIINNDIANPYIQGGFRLSSYTFLIDDYAMSEGNIKIFRDINDERDTYWRHVPGTSCHPFFTQNMSGFSGHNSTGNATGFSMYFTKRMSTPWVMDPTKLLKLVPKNPKFSNHTL